MENKKLYSCKEAASLIDELTEYMIRKMIKDGILIPIKLGRNVYVTQEAVYKAVFEYDTLLNHKPYTTLSLKFL